MARIKINDLPKDMKISGKELTAIRGGIKRAPAGIIIESRGSQAGAGFDLGSTEGFGLQPTLVAPLSGGAGISFCWAYQSLRKR